MATFPQTEVKVIELANNMLTGFNEHIADFPSVDALGLSDAITQYNIAKANQNQATAEAKVKTEIKNQKLATLIDLMQEDLKSAENDTDEDPEKLAYIDWGTRSPRTPIEIPLSPTNLRAIFDSTGKLTLIWDKPAVEKGRPVYNYIVQRRDKVSGEDETEVYGEWFMVDMAYKNETILLGQPHDLEMEYKVIATNSAGQSPASDFVAVVLK